MKIFKNKNFLKRDYECTNIVACMSEAAPDDNWVECEKDILTNLQKLWVQNGVHYYGYL